MTQSSPAADIGPASKERLRLWLRILKVSRSVEAELRENLRTDFETTLPRFDVMAALSRYKNGLKMSQLSGVLRVSNGNVTGIVDRLAEDGLMVRVAVPGDRRASLVRLTQRGLEEFERQAAQHEAWINTMLGGFGAEEAASLAERFDLMDEDITGKDADA